METGNLALIKHREVVFAELHPDSQQAHTAASALADAPGVMRAEPLSPTVLSISYDLLQISLEQIESALTEAGYHLSAKMLFKIKRALYYYTEETERANNGCPRGESTCTQRIFITRYGRQTHGCRDQRPEHWRKYL